MIPSHPTPPSAETTKKKRLGDYFNDFIASRFAAVLFWLAVGSIVASALGGLFRMERRDQEALREFERSAPGTERLNGFRCSVINAGASLKVAGTVYVCLMTNPYTDKFTLMERMRWVPYEQAEGEGNKP